MILNKRNREKGGASRVAKHLAIDVTNVENPPAVISDGEII